MSDPARWLDRDGLKAYVGGLDNEKIRRMVRAGKLPAPSYRMGPKSPLWWSADIDAALAGRVASAAGRPSLAEAILAKASRSDRNAPPG